jgi:hypothetical protein
LRERRRAKLTRQHRAQPRLLDRLDTDDAGDVAGGLLRALIGRGNQPIDLDAAEALANPPRLLVAQLRERMVGLDRVAGDVRLAMTNEVEVHRALLDARPARPCVAGHDRRRQRDGQARRTPSAATPAAARSG